MKATAKTMTLQAWILACLGVVITGLKSFYAGFTNILFLPPEMVSSLLYPAVGLAALWLVMIVLWTIKTKWEVN